MDFELPEETPAQPVNGSHPLNGPRSSATEEGKRDSVDVWDQRVAKGLAVVRRRLAGAYEVDDFGFDIELTDSVFYPTLKVLYKDWFRTEVLGIENVPDTGGGLLVGNHSGTLALDAIMLSVALRGQHPMDPPLRRPRGPP